MLKPKLEFFQKQMTNRLEEIRAVYKHKGVAGTKAELEFSEFLRSFLPVHNRIGMGEVFDSKGQVSGQVDVVITNEHHPYVSDFSSPSSFFIEGVFAVGEVKSNLQSKDVELVAKACEKFKALQANIPDGTLYSVGPGEDHIRFMDKRGYFLFAFESQLTLEKIKHTLESYYAANGTPVERQIDAVFCLDRGSIFNIGSGDGNLKWFENGKSCTGFQIKNSAPDSGTLFHLLRWLSILPARIAVMPSVLQSYF